MCKPCICIYMQRMGFLMDKTRLAGNIADSAADSERHPSRCGLELLDGIPKVACKPRGCPHSRLSHLAAASHHVPCECEMHGGVALRNVRCMGV